MRHPVRFSGVRFSGLRFLIAAALVLPFGLVAAEGSASAAAGTTCQTASGTATFKPPLPHLGSSTTVKPKIVVKHAKTSGCTGGGVMRATFGAVLKAKTATNCAILLAGPAPANPPIGTLTTTWNTGKTSTVAVTLSAVTGQPTEARITGTVTAGLFSGLHFDETIAFTPKTGDCVTTDLSAVTFVQVTPLQIS
jgi:hypothetical protein